MTDRERWTVYPLLMLSLGLAVFQTGAEQQNRSPDLEQVRCKVLEIVGPDGNAKITLKTNQAGDGVLETGPENAPLVRIGDDVTLFDADHKKFLFLGFDGPTIGLIEGHPGDKRYFPLATVPLLQELMSQERGNKSTPSEKSAKPEKPNEGGAPADAGKPSDTDK
jgi:hypothetical protein